MYFYEIWIILFSWFELIIQYVSQIVRIMSMTLNELVHSISLPDFVYDVVEWILGSYGHVTLFAFMLGAGLTAYIVISIVKYFVGIFK